MTTRQRKSQNFTRSNNLSEDFFKEVVEKEILIEGGCFTKEDVNYLLFLYSVLTL